MSNQNVNSIFVAIAFLALITGCAKKDLVVDMGHGDAIHLVGQADSFYCDDPAYANVEKVHTWELQFSDGTTKYLCTPKESVPTKPPEPTPEPHIVMVPKNNQSGERMNPSNLCMGAGCPQDN